MPRPENKDYILRKTFFLLLTKGYDGVSITDIQHETGMSRGIIYHYYGSKEELFRAAAERFLLKTFPVGIENTDGFLLTDMIRFVVQKYIAISKEWRPYAGAGKISIANYDFLFYQFIQKEKSFAKKYYQMRKEEQRAWIAAAELSLSKGEIRPVLNVEKIAAHFILLLDGIWIQSTEKGSVGQSIRLTSSVLHDYYGLIKI